MAAEVSERPVRVHRSAPPALRHSREQAAHKHWTGIAGARLLVVGPGPEYDALAEFVSRQGVHTTHSRSILDGLVQFGRVDPVAIVVAADAPGPPVAQFVHQVRCYGAPFVAVSVEAAASAASRFRHLGAALMSRPHTPAQVWQVLEENCVALREHVVVSYGPIELDSSAYVVTVDRVRIADLPLREFALLRALVGRAPAVLADDELRTATWGEDGASVTDNTVAARVARLRRRLAGVAQIRRVRGRGYSLALD